MTMIGKMIAGMVLATVTLTPQIATAQNDDLPAAPTPSVPQTVRSVQAFIPRGWKLEQSVRGDLNGDKLADIAVAIRSTDPNLIVTNKRGLGRDQFDSNPRTIIVALAQKGGGFRRVAVNNTLIPRIDNGVIDDPFEDNPMVIAGGALKIAIRFWSSAGSWSMSSTSFSFRYRDGGMFLVGYDQTDIDRSSGEEIKISANFLTGRMSTAVGSIEHSRVKTSWKNIGRKPLIRFENVGDAWEFSPAPRAD